jgi:hypothetical protein
MRQVVEPRASEHNDNYWRHRGSIAKPSSTLHSHLQIATGKGPAGMATR